MLSVVSHIHIARNLGSLINVIKISQQMFDHHESHHLLCITEVFRNSKNKKQKKKNPQNKIKKHNNSINSCSVKCFVHYFIKIKSLSKVIYLEEGRVGIPIPMTPVQIYFYYIMCLLRSLQFDGWPWLPWSCFRMTEAVFLAPCPLQSCAALLWSRPIAHWTPSTRLP